MFRFLVNQELRPFHSLTILIIENHKMGLQMTQDLPRQVLSKPQQNGRITPTETSQLDHDTNLRCISEKRVTWNRVLFCGIECQTPSDGCCL